MTAASRYYVSQQRLAARVRAATRKQWFRMGLNRRRDLDDTWREIAAPLRQAVEAGQTIAVRGAAEVLPDALAEVGLPDEPAARVRERSLVGTAGDGRDLDSLLYGSVLRTKREISRGLTLEQALAEGERFLDLASSTAVADAGREATQLLLIARPDVPGYVRHVNLPACARCVLLAGRVYRTDASFLRHPGCDCTVAPSTARGQSTVDPAQAIRDGQVRGLSAADRQAVLDGADPSRVINARRGMYTTAQGFKATRELARRRRATRLRPEAIYQATSDRAQQIELLRQHGYLA